MKRKERIKGLNRRVFYRELKENLKPEYVKDLRYFFEDWVKDYQESLFITGVAGWYELKASESKYNYSHEIKTN